MSYQMSYGSMDISNTGDGMAYHLNWKFSDKDIALYDSELSCSPPTDYMELYCLIALQAFV